MSCTKHLYKLYNLYKIPALLNLVQSLKNSLCRPSSGRFTAFP